LKVWAGAAGARLLKLMARGLSHFYKKETKRFFVAFAHGFSLSAETF
jgi:hypothetical protein